MSELDELKAQRREINERIRQLESNMNLTGCVKFDKQIYPCRPDEWFIAVKPIQNEEKIGRRIYRSVIRSTDRQEVIDSIDILVNDLIELKKKLKGESNGKTD